MSQALRSLMYYVAVLCFNGYSTGSKLCVVLSFHVLT